MRELPLTAANLARSEVHLVTFRLNLAGPALRQLAACLAPDEQARAARYRHERDRNRFVAARAQLRHLLAAYTGIDASRLCLPCTQQGKPFVEGQSKPDGVRFNLSHSEDLALVAVVRGLEIGVDIESLRPLADCERIARSYFSGAEFAQWRAVPEAERLQAFFTCWTRKEAYVKALGGGLSMDLRAFDVSVDPQAQQGLCSVGGSAEAALGWTLRSVTPAPGFCAAFAGEGTSLRLVRVDLA